jgi:signal transduction histidine kinase
MISKMAHELRSPLTSVKGFSSTLISRWDRFSDEQRFELVQTIHSDAERMGRIVSEVLDLARLEAGRLELHRAQVEVAEIIGRSVEHVGSLSGAGRIVVDVGDDLVLLADPDRLQHVFFNLIENAVKFSEEGSIEVRGGRDGSSVVVTVSDRGVGIPDDRLAEIFMGPGPTGQTATPSGTGLGLYLSKKLVEAHGGTISVESRQDEGSTFTVRLPAVDA